MIVCVCVCVCVCTEHDVPCLILQYIPFSSILNQIARNVCIHVCIKMSFFLPYHN